MPAVGQSVFDRGLGNEHPMNFFWLSLALVAAVLDGIAFTSVAKSLPTINMRRSGLATRAPFPPLKSSRRTTPADGHISQATELVEFHRDHVVETDIPQSRHCTVRPSPPSKEKATVILSVP